MDWLELLMGLTGGGLTGTLGSIFYFRPKLKEATASASKSETEAKEARHDYLEKRIESMEKMYNEQGAVLDSLRLEVLKLGKEKFVNEQRIVQLEAENKALTGKVDKLEKEIGAYKVLTKQ